MSAHGKAGGGVDGWVQFFLTSEQAGGADKYPGYFAKNSPEGQREDVLSQR